MHITEDTYVLRSQKKNFVLNMIIKFQRVMTTKRNIPVIIFHNLVKHKDTKFFFVEQNKILIVSIKTH